MEKCTTWMHCKSLWIKASAKCIDVNVNTVLFVCRKFKHSLEKNIGSWSIINVRSLYRKWLWNMLPLQSSFSLARKMCWGPASYALITKEFTPAEWSLIKINGKSCEMTWAGRGKKKKENSPSQSWLRTLCFLSQNWVNNICQII